MEKFAVIMAGGVGSRFWPRSKQAKPKQLIRIFGENTMIQDTVGRLDGLIKPDHIYVITNKIQRPRVLEQLPQIPKGNIIAEPFGKNTAPCIGLAAALVEAKNKDAIMITLPADHLIQDTKGFQDTINTAVDYAYESKGLLTIGIKPTHPETGYGYIQVDDNVVADGIHKVMTFAEKPNIATAKRFMEVGDFMWNSGMFIWRTDAILNEIEKYMPELHEGLQELKPAIGTDDFDEVLTKVYGQVKSISIDYGIMEKSDKVFLTKGKFDWNDVGSWEAVYRMTEKDENKNACIGDVYTEDTKKSYVFSPKKFTALIGVSNVVVIDTDDALLICKRDKAQNVKEVVDYLKLHNKSNLI
ncbi:MAG: mannose-1-phosphate guanylyltransferase [Melioribacteraceae bacterium]|nr:mannose-1-phosphate guanylyltransferase [Melioribacteraceae bacterium]